MQRATRVNRQSQQFSKLDRAGSRRVNVSMKNVNSNTMKSLGSSFVLAVMLGWSPFGSAGALPEYDRVRILEDPKPISAAKLELRNHRDEPFSMNDLRGRPALVFFGFTNCPDVCPATMAKMRDFRSQYPEIADRVEIVLVSVDGERDSPAVLNEFLGKFESGFLGVTGNPGDVLRVANQFRAPFYKGSPSSDDRTYSVAHSPAVFVLDAESRLRAEFYNSSLEAMAGVSSALLGEI